MKFTINKKDGKKFSNLSGDKNPIHLIEKVGYNSIFGETICHGVLVLINFFIKINLQKKIKNKKFFQLKIIFFEPAKYNHPIIIKKRDTIMNYIKKIIKYAIYIFPLRIIKIKKFYLKKILNLIVLKKILIKN